MSGRRVVPRRQQKDIVDLDADPRDAFCLKVTAKYLKMDARTLRSRVDEGLIEAIEDRRMVKFTKDAIRAYEQHRPSLNRRAS